MKTRSLLAAILLLSGAVPALALRCGTSLVTEGQSKYDVVQRCGEPSYAKSRVEYRPVGYPPTPRPLDADPSYYPAPYPPMQEVVIDEWVYNFGSTQLMSSLIFENDRLVTIRSLGYGR